MYTDDSRVSCANCEWVLEDPEWCCKNDCNDKTGPNYRQAYVCADPSDKTGRLTSRCEVDTECKRDAPPVMCSASRLGELQKYNSVLDPKCAGRPAFTPNPATSAPWASRQPTTIAPFGTSAPWGTSAPRGTSRPM
jgi:hypothetical protein